MLGQIFGAELEFPVRAAIALVVVAALLGLTVLLVRRMSGRARTVAPRGRGTPRLAVMDSIPVDQRRRLILVRRDETEHLLLVGGTSDVVVEKDIAAREPVPQREAVQREALQREAPQRRPLAASIPPASVAPPAAAAALTAGAAAGALAAPPPLLAGNAAEEPARDPFAEALSQALKLDDGPVPAAASAAAPATDLAPTEPQVSARPAPEPARGREGREPKRPMLGRRPLMRGDGRPSGEPLATPVGSDAVRSALAAPPPSREEAPRLPPLGAESDRKPPLPPVIAPRAFSPLAALGLGKPAQRRHADKPAPAPSRDDTGAAPQLRGGEMAPEPKLDSPADRATDATAPEREAPRLTLSDLLGDSPADEKGTAAPAVMMSHRTAGDETTDSAVEPVHTGADERAHIPVLSSRPRREPLVPFDRLGRGESRPRKPGPEPVTPPLASASGAAPATRPREFAFRAAETAARVAPVLEPTWRKGSEEAPGELHAAPVVTPEAREPERAEPLLHVEPSFPKEEPAPAPEVTLSAPLDTEAKAEISAGADTTVIESIVTTQPAPLTGSPREEEGPAAETAPDVMVAATETVLIGEAAAPLSPAEETKGAEEKPASDPFDELDAEMANLLGRSSAQVR